MPLDDTLPSVDPETAANDRATAVYQGMLDRGMDKPTALGWAANAKVESQANPYSPRSSSGAAGTFQWVGPRLDVYRALHGHDPEDGDLNEHLDHVVWENQNIEAPAWQAIQRAPADPVAKAVAIRSAWERPGRTPQEIASEEGLVARAAKGLSGLLMGSAQAAEPPQQGVPPALTSQIQAARKAGYDDPAIFDAISKSPRWSGNVGAALKAHPPEAVAGFMGLSLPKPDVDTGSWDAPESAPKQTPEAPSTPYDPTAAVAADEDFKARLGPTSDGRLVNPEPSPEDQTALATMTEFGPSATTPGVDHPEHNADVTAHRIADAAQQAWQGTQPFLAPQAEQWLRGKGVPDAAIAAVNSPQYAIAAYHAVMSGGMAGLNALLEPVIGEQAARELTAMPEAFPLAGHEIGGLGVPGARLTPAESTAMRQAQELSHPMLDNGAETPAQTAGRTIFEEREALNREMAQAAQRNQPRLAGPETAPVTPEAAPVAPVTQPGAVAPAPGAPVAGTEAAQPAPPQTPMPTPSAAMTVLKNIAAGRPAETPPPVAAPPVPAAPPPQPTAPLPQAVAPQAPPQQPTQEPPHPATGGYAMVDPRGLTLDPQRFQFKESGEGGVTGALHGINRWEPALANPITTWQGNDGNLYVVNGHQRTDLALRAQQAGQENVQMPARIFREADGYTPEYMRMLGAYQNMAEGTGTAVDAAKVLRGATAIPDAMQLPALPPRQQIVQQGRALAKLSPEAFGAVENGVVAPAYAAHVGDMISDPTEQMAALDVLARAQPANTDQARLMVQDVRNSGFLRGSQTTLFGDEDFARSLIPERAKVLDNAMRTLRRVGGVFRAAVQGEESLTSAGNRMDTAANTQAGTENGRLLDTLQRNATTRGPVSDALTVAARDLADGKPIAGVSSRFLATTRGLVRSGQDQGVQPGASAHGEEPARQDVNPDQAAEFREELGPGLFENRVPLFSPVERAVDGLKQSRGTGEQMLAQITKTPGVKPEEVKWMGLDDWLKGQKSVTREQIADYVRANQLDVREVQKPSAEPDQFVVTSASGPMSVRRPYSERFDTREQAEANLAERQQENPTGFHNIMEMPQTGTAPKFGSYVLPGGENYRELLITLPESQMTPASKRMTQIEQILLAPNGSLRADAPELRAEYNRLADETRANSQVYQSPHWKEPNVLAHVRFDERTAPDGAKVLMVHEIQSDAHQAGRKQGYRDQHEIDELKQKIDRANKAMDVMAADREPITNRMKQEDLWHQMARGRDAARELLAIRERGVPNLPFAKSWPALVMKRIIKLAADNGFDRVAWAPGEVQAERYDLSKQISRIILHDNSSGGIGRPRMEGPFERGSLEAYDHNGRKIIDRTITGPDQLPDIIGKEASDKLLAAKPNETRRAGLGIRERKLEGLDLKVGGEGMKAFYDKMLPNETNKIVGKFGGKVGQSEVRVEYDNRDGIKPDAQAVADHDAEWQRVLKEIHRIEAEGPRVHPSLTSHLYDELDQIHAKMIDETAARGRPQPVHSVDVTPAMRKAIQTQGLGLFAGRRLPLPPPIGSDLLGVTRAAPTQRTPEPTIRTDQRQQTMPGMEPSAVQAQASRDAQGPRGNQLPADQGLFARPEAQQPELPTTPKFTDPKWQELVERNERAKAAAAGYAEAGKPVRFVDPKYGHTYLISKDLNYPPDGWRMTMFAKDGTPTGHLEFKSANEAFLEATRHGYQEITPPVSRWNPPGFRDEIHTVPDLNGGQEGAAAWVLERGRENGMEHLAVVDNATGCIVHAGTSDRVNFVSFDPRDLMTARDAYTLHHNHPSGAALSSPDITFLAAQGMSHIVAHGHNGETYSASLAADRDKRSTDEPSLARHQKDLSDAYAKAQRDAENILVDLVRRGVITRREGDASYADLTNRLLNATGLTHYVSTYQQPGPVIARLTQILKARGHDPAIIDRSTVAVRPEERIAGVSRSVAGQPGEGAPRGEASTSGRERVPGTVQGRLLEGLHAPDDLTPEQRWPVPSPGVPNLVEQGPPRAPRETLKPTQEASGELPLSEPPQPDQGHNGGPPMPPDSLWPTGERPPSPPPPRPEIEAARITAPRATKNLNPVERLTIFPQTVASLDDMSARFWNSWKNRERDETTNAAQLRAVVQPHFLKLSKADRLKVAGALEVARIEGAESLIENPDGTITARNGSTPHANWSKVGDSINLSPEETAAYHEAVQLGRKQWVMLQRAAAKRYGWGGGLDPATIRAEAQARSEPEDFHKLNRLADLLDVMQANQQEIYFPMQRFGSYFIAIRPKSGPDVVENLGGKPPLAWFETVEKPALQDLLGTTQGRTTVQARAAKRIAELQKQFPPDKFDYQQGDFARTPSLLRQINIPAVEKLFMLMENKVKAGIQDAVMRGDNPPSTAKGVRAEAKNRYEALHGSTLEAFYDALFEELKAGYRRRAKVVPGYSPDFDRAVAGHLYQIARNAADTAHRDGVESDYQNIQDYHPHQNIKNYWRDWRAYQEDPGSPLSRAAATLNQVGFAYMLGMNPSSTLIIASHMPMTAAPVLSVGVGPRVAVPALTRGLGRAYGALRFDTVHGGHIDLEKAMAGMPPEKQAFLRRMADEGRLAAVGTHDMAALNDRLAPLFHGYSDVARRAMEIATSNVHAVDQANRFAVASAAWDIASDPTSFNAAAGPLMRHNAVFRDMVQREMGLSPESYGRFMLSRAAFDWGKANQAPLMRGPLGQLMFALHGFQTRYLSTAFNLMKNGGSESRLAFYLMMAALGLGAGAMGLPFAQDAMKGADEVWKHFTGRDPALKYKIHDAIQDNGFGAAGADVILNGPLSYATGVNLGSRIGFGDVLEREFESSNVLGTIPSIAWSAWSGASQRYGSGQPAAAVASEAVPAALRGPLRARATAEQGIVSRRGVEQIPPGDVSGADLAKIGLGFQPMSVMKRADETGRYVAAQNSQDAWKGMIKAGDTEGAISEMRAAGWGTGRIKGFVRQSLQPPTIGRQFQRFEQNRPASPP